MTAISAEVLRAARQAARDLPSDDADAAWVLAAITRTKAK